VPAAEEGEEGEADGVKGRGAQVVGEALDQDRAPGREVEEAKEEIEVIQALEVFWGVDIVGR
jgi:hypothetical protein